MTELYSIETPEEAIEFYDELSEEWIRVSSRFYERSTHGLDTEKERGKLDYIDNRMALAERFLAYYPDCI